MPDLTAIYQAFDTDKPLPADDDERYVDLSSVRGDSHIARRLMQLINNNAARTKSHHLVMGHNKCGKTTELNRAKFLLDKNGYATVFFDMADFSTRTFEYTTLLLVMIGQVVEQLAKLEKKIKVKGETAQRLAEFLREKEITFGREFSADATGKIEVEAAPGFLANLLGKLGLGLELRGGFARSREITMKIEADTRRFLDAIQELIVDAKEKVAEAGYKGLVVICDGCDKLEINATDREKSYDLQRSMFVDHAADLQSVPCHVIYTVPISIPVHLGDIWEQDPEFVPAIPVNKLPGIEDSYPAKGVEALCEVVNRRLTQHKTSIELLFENLELLNRLIAVSGGHISDLIMLVRGAVFEAQMRGLEQITEALVNRSISIRAREYTRLVESKHLETLATIAQYRTPQSNDDIYRDVIFKRLALEYACGDDTRVDLHPLVAASDAYRRYSNPQST